MSDQNKKPRLPRYISPAGIAVFPRLAEPDFKFKKDHGEYSVKLRLPEAEAQKILALAEAVVEQSYNEQTAAHAGKMDKKGKKIELKKADLSYSVELDDNQTPTGNLLISFKMNGGYLDKTGVKQRLSVPTFDSKGNPLKADIWGGSKIKVAYQIAPYFAAADLKCGASFRLVAVQVIDLVSKNSGSAASFGFAEEQGFVAEPEAIETQTVEGSGDGQARAKGDF